jgi:hypothetical protein
MILARVPREETMPVKECNRVTQHLTQLSIGGINAPGTGDMEAIPETRFT